MVKIEATNKKEGVDISLEIDGSGRDIAEEMEAIVSELYMWMLNTEPAIFVDHIAKMTAKGLALIIGGYEKHKNTDTKKEKARAN